MLKDGSCCLMATRLRLAGGRTPKMDPVVYFGFGGDRKARAYACNLGC